MLLSPPLGLRPAARLVLLASLVLLSGSRADAADRTSALLGSWDLAVETPSGERPAWIRISGDEGKPEILMVGLVGHATSVREVSLHSSDVTFTASKDDFGFPADMVFRGTVAGHELQGIATDAAGDHWRWHGTKAPGLLRSAHAGPVRWGRPLRLLDAKSLAGWRLRDLAKSGTWTVADGVLGSSGNGSDLVSEGTFGDFKLHLEFMAGPNANSGIYLRGRYEVQIETDSVAEPASHHTGGVYGFLAPEPEQPRRAGVWQTLDITLIGRDLTVVQNGVTVIDHRAIPGITGGALDSEEQRPGPMMLQGSEGGEVRFRNIVLWPALP